MTFAGSISIKVSALLLLSLGTILFFNLYDRYVVIGPELLTDALFSDNLTKWEPSGQDISVPTTGAGIARLHSDNSEIIVNLSQVIPDVPRYTLLRLSCDIKTSNISQSQGGWNVARVILVPHDAKGEPMYHLPHTLVHLRGTHEWGNHAGVFAVDATTTKVRLSVQLAHTTGTMWVKNLSLRPLAEVVSFSQYRIIAIILWATAAVWIAMPLAWSAFSNMHCAVVIACALAIVLSVLMPEAFKEHIGNILFPSLAKQSFASPGSDTFRFLPLLPTLDIYKIGHFVLFMTLTTITFYRRPYPGSQSKIFGYLLVFALVTEVLQLFTNGRSAQFGDVLIDSAGIATGFMLLLAVRTLYPPRN